MYDINLRRELKDATVGDIIDILNTLPKDCKANFNGDNYGYIHVEKDKSVMSFDDSSLDEEYYSEKYNKTEMARINKDVFKRKCENIDCKCKSCKYSKMNRCTCSNCISCINGKLAIEDCCEYEKNE